MGFPVDWTGTPDDTGVPFFPDVSGWTKVIATGTPTIDQTTDPAIASTVSWDNDSDAIANDGSACAAATVQSGGTVPTPTDQTFSNILRLKDWGLAIPSGNDIKAILIVTNMATAEPVNAGEGYMSACLQVGGNWFFVGGPEGNANFYKSKGWTGNNDSTPPATDANSTSFVPDWWDDDYRGFECDAAHGGILAILGDFNDGVPPPVITVDDVNDTDFAVGIYASSSSGLDGVPNEMAVNIYAVGLAVYYAPTPAGPPDGDPLKNKIDFDIQPFEVTARESSQSLVELNPFIVGLRTGAFINVDLTMFKKDAPFGNLEVKALPFLLFEKVPQNRQTFKLTGVNYADEYYDHDTDFINGFVLFNGGDAGAGGDDSGSGDSSRYRPTLYSDQGQTASTDPQNAFDTFPDSFANISGTYNKGDGQLDCIVGYNGFPNVVVHADTHLNIDMSIVMNFAGAVDIWLNGATILNTTSNRVRSLLMVVVHAGTNLSTLALQVFAVGTPHGDDNTAAIVNVYDIYVDKP